MNECESPSKNEFCCKNSDIFTLRSFDIIRKKVIVQLGNNANMLL